MKKYYTPKIEEFYRGFEFEMKCLNSWIQLTFDIEGFNSICNIEHKKDGTINYSLPEKIIRVKFLDGEDVESLEIPGWASIDKLPARHKYRIVAIENNSMKRVVVFQGVIKNKSQLKQILILTGVINENKNNS